MFANRSFSAAQRSVLLTFVFLTSVAIAGDIGTLCCEYYEQTLNFHRPESTWKRDDECSEFKCTAEGKITKSTCHTEPRHPDCALSPNHRSKPFPDCCSDILCPMHILIEAYNTGHADHAVHQHNSSEKPKDASVHRLYSQDGGHQRNGLYYGQDTGMGRVEQKDDLQGPREDHHHHHHLDSLVKPAVVPPYPALAALASASGPEDPTKNGGQSVDAPPGALPGALTEAVPEAPLEALLEAPLPEALPEGDAGVAPAPTDAQSYDTSIMMVPINH